MNKSGITPIGDRCIVYVPPLEEKTAGGIIIPEMNKKRKEAAQEAGFLISIGETATMQLDTYPKPGDKVLITKYAGNTHKGIDDKDYRIVSGDDILAIMEQ